MLLHVLTFIYIVSICSNISPYSLEAVLHFLVYLLLYRLYENYVGYASYEAFDEVEVKWSICATSRQRKRHRARWRRRLRKQLGLRFGKGIYSPFRRRKLPFHPVMKCLRRDCKARPQPYGYYREGNEGRHMIRELVKDLPMMYRKLKQLKQRMKKNERARNVAAYEKYIKYGRDKFKGYLSESSQGGRYCFTREVPMSTIDKFCSSFDAIESFRVFKMVEEEQLTLVSSSTERISDWDDMTLEDHRVRAQQTVNRANMFLTQCKALQNLNKFDDMLFTKIPCVWDTGASFGLTPFRDDFIEYHEVEIPVEDITKVNTVIGLGRVMWKFRTVSGEIVHLPIVAYHLPETNIRLFSPQTFHQLHNGESGLVSAVGLGAGRLIRMTFPRLHVTETVEIPIDPSKGSVPIAFDVSCTDEERIEMGPRLDAMFQRESKPLNINEPLAMARQAMALTKRSMPREWDDTKGQFTFNFSSTPDMCCPSVGDDGNKNLGGPQKELLQWH